MSAVVATAPLADARLPISSLAAYGAFGMPLAMAALPLYVHLPKFYGETLGVDLAALGVLLLVLRLADGLVDPWLGAISDRIARRRGLIGIAAPVLAVGMVALFSPPDGGAVITLSWLGAALAVVYVAFSVATINHSAWGAELSPSPVERTRITAVRESLALAGVVVASVAPALLAGADGEALGLQRFALVFAATTLVSLLPLALAPRPSSISAATRARSGMLAPLRDRTFRWLLAAFMANGVASAIPATLVLFFIADVLRASAAQGWLLALYFLAGAAGMPLWVALSARIGKLAAWAVAMLLAIGAFAGAVALGSGDVVAFALICAVSGLALGADLALPPSLLADVVGRSDAAAGAGAYFGVWTLATKLNLAFAAGLALPLLAWLGYVPGSSGADGLRALALVYAALPCVLKLAALALVVTLARRKGGST
jgi:Na+/melibiose symporter-like transporter